MEMKPSGSGFKFDFENITEREISNVKKKRKPKISLAMIIMAVIVIIADCFLVGVWVKKYRQMNDNSKTVPYSAPRHIEIKSFSYYNSMRVETPSVQKNFYRQPFTDYRSVKKDRTQNQIKQDETHIYSWTDEKGIRHYSDVSPSDEAGQFDISDRKSE